MATEHKKLAEAFRLTKTLVKTNVEEPGIMFVCVALNSLRIKGHISVPTYNLAKKVIEHRLAPATTLENWAINNIPEVRMLMKQHDQKFVSRQLLAYKHRWIDSLIEEFEGESSEPT